jgi:membrane dipeptidase
MSLDRRAFLSALAAAGAGLALPARAGSLLSGSWFISSGDATDRLFEKARVVDSLGFFDDELLTDEGWEIVLRSGITAIQTSLSNRNLEAALTDLADWQSRFDRHPDRLTKVLSASDVDRAKREGKLGVILGFQNATCIEDDVENLKALYAAGTRCIQLTYNSRNLLGDGCTERTNAGLSDFGVGVVETMNELGIIVDLSHCGERTSRDGIEISRKPPAFTHTMCQALHDHPRAKSDDLLRAMAHRGGMVGIVSLGYFIGPTPETSFEDYLDHVDHAVQVAGIDHVGLASDYSIRGIESTATRESWYEPRLTWFKPSYNVRWPPWIPELDKPERFRTTAHGLATRGYRSGDIEKLLGGNWIRYFGDALG